MKKVISVILIALTILLSSSYVLGATGKVTADTLNVRESASKSAKIIARIAKDQEVEILEDNGEWLKIKYRTYTGFVSSSYIKKDVAEEKPTNTTPVNETKAEPVEEKKEETEKVVETTKTQDTEYISNKETKLKENVKVYSLPTLSSYTVGELNLGTSLLVINSAGQWAYVQTDNLSGWIKLTATEIEVSIETTTETPKEEPKEPEVQNTTVEENKVENNNVAEPENKVEEQATTSDNSSYPKTMYTNKASVIVRYSPSKESGILNSFNKGAKVRVTGKEGEWYKVSISGDTGYIYYTLLSDTNN